MKIYRQDFFNYAFSKYGPQIMSTKHNRNKIETIDYKQKIQETQKL